MEKEFVPYPLALRMKQLGFDERCFRHEYVKKTCENHEQPGGCQLPNVHCGYPNCTIDESVEPLSIPIWQQAFRWFRENYDWTIKVNQVSKNNWSYTLSNFPNDKKYYGELCQTYEEAEIACLEKLIMIVE